MATWLVPWGVQGLKIMNKCPFPLGINPGMELLGWDNLTLINRSVLAKSSGNFAQKSCILASVEESILAAPSLTLHVVALTGVK